MHEWREQQRTDVNRQLNAGGKKESSGASPRRFARLAARLKAAPLQNAIASGERLASDIAGIETARDGGVGGAFDDGATVGEQGHLIGVVPEFQDESVVADGAVGLEAAVHLGEVDGALALMDLHGIPPAQRDMRTGLTREMDEIALTAGAATGAGLGGGDFGVLIGPEVEGEQRAAELGLAAYEQFKSFRGRDRCHQIYR